MTDYLTLGFALVCILGFAACFYLGYIIGEATGRKKGQYGK